MVPPKVGITFVLPIWAAYTSCEARDRHPFVLVRFCESFFCRDAIPQIPERHPRGDERGFASPIRRYPFSKFIRAAYHHHHHPFLSFPSTSVFFFFFFIIRDEAIRLACFAAGSDRSCESPSTLSQCGRHDKSYESSSEYASFSRSFCDLPLLARSILGWRGDGTSHGRRVCGAVDFRARPQ